MVTQDERPAEHDSGDEKISPAEFTKRMDEDEGGDGAGPGAPEVIEPTQGREDDGPAGPPQRDLGKR